MMNKYLITITYFDGSSSQASGLYANDWDAFNSVIDSFPLAASVTPRRLA